jgi:hypothetical protein
MQIFCELGNSTRSTMHYGGSVFILWFLSVNHSRDGWGVWLLGDGIPVLGRVGS